MAPNPKNLGIAAGIVWGIACAFTALFSVTGIGLGFVQVLGSFYLGYQPGAMGAILGLIYGFIDGFIGGYLVAWIYNMLGK